MSQGTSSSAPEPARELPAWVQVLDHDTPQERYEIAAGGSRLTVHSQGAHITRWFDGQRERLWLSQTSRFEPGVAIRGGIPICLPWFATGPDGDRTPSHGFARLARWRLAGWGENGLGARGVEFQLAPEDVADLPGSEWMQANPFRAALQVQLGESLTTRLILANLTDRPLRLEAALHTYLPIGGPDTVRIEGLDGVRYRDKVTRQDAVQTTPLQLGEEIDRIYATGTLPGGEGAAPVQLSDPAHAHGQSTRITSHNAPQTVIWNPGADKGPGIADISDWRSFVCVEAAAIGQDALVLPAAASGDVVGAVVRLSQSIG